MGVPAGIFSPLLAFATIVGLIAGTLIEMLLTAAALPVPPLIGAAFTVAAMGGLFSATIRAPLVGVVLVVELTGGYELILPVIITCVTAHVVAEWLHGRPIYEVLLERSLRLAGHPPRDEDTDGVGVPGGEVPLALEPPHDSGEGNHPGRHDRRIVQRQGQRVRHVHSWVHWNMSRSPPPR